ncbi:hypothetical protein B0H16DRAFT_1750694 [Mycena metata]|uniref:Ribonuclease H1 N-terminal domain-containing protein n=1 Tax=Mycena metata TaxID=1033252 RepID=A0AAD7DMU6_9AGAR|nr:hypothetical protein B0H16DRAFT_1750694 [Mycena metata]
MRPSSSPPPYAVDADSGDDPHNAELLDMLQNLRLTPVSRSEPLVHRTFSRSPATPPRLDPALRGGRLYAFDNPTQRAVTPFWSEAASASQGVPGGSTQRLTPTNSKKKRSRGCGGYAVFFGRQTGAFRAWFTEAEPLVKGVNNSLYQGHDTFLQAQAAYNYIRERGCTRTLPHAPDSIAERPMTELPVPVGLLDRVNPLHARSGLQTGLWYIVYAGITPGVYQSSLECSLNTLGLSSAVFESCADKAEAIVLFQNAVAHGDVRCLRPTYH